MSDIRNDSLKLYMLLPQRINGRAITSIGNFIPGNGASLPAFKVMTPDGDENFSSHFAVYNNTNEKWFLWRSRYGQTREEAERRIYA